MNAQGITANIMSLGGIAIAIGATIGASIVMVENALQLSGLGKDARRRQAKAGASSQRGRAGAVFLVVDYYGVFSARVRLNRTIGVLHRLPYQTYAMAAAAQYR